jgi:hypothetical protein
MFFVSDAQLTPQRTALCPACDAPVKAPPGAPKRAGAPAVPAAAPAAAHDPFGPPPPSGSKKKLYIIVGAAAAVLIILGIVIAVATSGPSVDYEKEAAKAVEAKRKAFEEISTKAGSPSATPGSKAPATANPTPAPATPAPVKAQAPAVRPAVTPAPVAAPQAPAASPAAKASVPLNAEALAKVRTDVLTLHPYYLGLVLTPSEKARLDGIVAGGRGVPEDADFLQALLTGGKLKAARDEIALVAQTIPTLDRESQEGLPVDKVTLNDGRVLQCRVLDESPDVVKVSRLMSGGVGGQLPLRRETITRIEKGKGVGTDFTARWESAQKGSTAGLVELLVWCKENALAGQAKLVAYTIVKVDPSNTQARTEAGLPADPVKTAEEASRGGIIAYQGRNWPAKELKEKLIKDGYTVMDGQWYSRKEKMIVVPGLFRYERQQDKPVIFGGNGAGGGLLCHDVDITYKTVQDANSNQFLETPEIKYLRRFYAPPMVVQLSGRLPPGIIAPPPTYELDIRVNVDEGLPPQGTPMKGELTINVPVGEPLLEASVITTAEVKAGASITVYHTVGSGENEKRTKLYICDPRETQSHTIPPELIRGQSEVNLVAVIEEQASYLQKVDRRHARAAVMKGKYQVSPAVDVIHYRLIPEYKAVLFPSNSNTIEVFRLRAVVADPAPQFTKLFASNPDLLK